MEIDIRFEIENCLSMNLNSSVINMEKIESRGNELIINIRNQNGVTEFLKPGLKGVLKMAHQTRNVVISKIEKDHGHMVLTYE